MPLAYLLDTSVFCQPIKDHPVEAVLERWSSIGDSAVCTSALCCAEVRAGLESRKSDKYWQRYSELLHDQYQVLPFDEETARTYAELSSQLKSTGKTKPVVDLMIAATAKCHGLVVATLKGKDFEDIPGVAVEDWATM
ncbi:MAG: type II toxin-antitoxin system VapC family toxin [Verrucomicrobia bacterium]|nr:type II toxin-antitoxin system VapC family toxin [Verrucomicrobiota bacterium]